MEDTILDNPTSSNETDRFSRLPEDIIGQILFSLPAKDAACTTILSKKWLHLWNSLPVFSFRSDALHGKDDLLIQDGSFDAEADKYMDLIDRSLEKLRHCKVRIKRFQLELFKSHERHSSRFNEFIELANKNQVNELAIHGLVANQSRDWPSLPLATVASTNSFEVVDLKSCVLRPELLQCEPKFPCLRRLYLYRVKFLRDNMVENLLDNCPLLEEFSLAHCGVERVNLRDHPTLNKVRIVGVGVIRNVPLELHMVNCNNIRELDLCSTFTAEDIQEFVARLPLLEKLILKPCIPLQRLKISSPSLLHLSLHTSPGVGATGIEIDAPNLNTYSYLIQTKEAATSPVFIRTERLKVARLLVKMGTHNLPTSQWFIHLKNCLESFQYNALGIYVECDMTNKDSALENLQRISTPPPAYLEFLSVNCSRRSFDFPALFDCCFWICRPQKIYIDSDWGSDTDFMNLLRDNLIAWEENPRCCKFSLRKCWRHDLEEVKIHKVITENAEHRPAGLTISPQSHEREKKLIAVQLKWKVSGQKRKFQSAATQEIIPTTQRPRLFAAVVTKVLHFLADPSCIFNTR